MLHALFVGSFSSRSPSFGRLGLSGRLPAGVDAAPVPCHAAVGAGSFCALGFAITAVIPNADAAAAIVNATILPLLFLSGIFIPLGDNAPAWIVWTARIFPVKHFADGMQALPRHAVSLERCAVVALWGPGGLLFAVRFFSWEPRT